MEENSSLPPTAPLALRKWDVSRDKVTIALTHRPNDVEMVRLNQAIRAFVAALNDSIAISVGDTVECVDAWDSFHNLTVGKKYDVLNVRGGVIFLRGDTGHIGGWYDYKFKRSEPMLSPQPSTLSR